MTESSPNTDNSTTYTRRRGPVSAAVVRIRSHKHTAWFVALAVLVIAEGMTLGVAYDSDALERIPPGWWTPLFHAAPRSMPLAAAVATAALLVVGPRVSQRLRATPSRFNRLTPLFLLGHLLAFGALFWTCGALFDEDAPVPAHPGPWVLACLILCVFVAVTWVAALLPPSVLPVVARESLGPAFLSLTIGAAAWAFGRYTLELGAVLRDPTLHSAAALLRVWEPLTQVDPSSHVIETGTFAVEVSPECSGYEGVGLVLAFLATYFWLFRRRLRFPQALLILPVAAVAVWCANILRIAVLMTIGSHVSKAIALGSFHSYAGSILFCGTALACVAIVRGSALMSKPEFAALPDVGTEDLSEDGQAGVASDPQPATNPAAPYLVPFLAVVATGLITAAFSPPGTDPLYALRLVVAAVALWPFRSELARVLGATSGRGAAVAVSVGAAVAAAWLALSLFWDSANAPGDAGTLHGLAPPWHPSWFVARAAGTILMAPLVEELAFRGFLARRLMAAHFDEIPLSRLSPFAVAASSVLFAALHSHFVGAVLAGLAYAVVARRRGRLIDAVLAHAATNTLLVAYAAASGAWHVLE